LHAALPRTPALDAQCARTLLARFADLDGVVACGCGGLMRLGVPALAARWLAAPDRRRIEADLEWLIRSGVSLVCAGDALYPSRLEAVPGAPAALYVAGDVGLLSEPQVAIVGSRAASRGGRDTAARFAAELGRYGLAVTSGLAVGIDAAAHRGALAAGAASVAVGATGLDRVYPACHRALADALERDGAVVSEFGPGTPPRSEHFPRRNRIISGLSLGVLVVEAARRSGSLITARLAAEQGREVFAIPGSIHSPGSRGCHALLRQGATLVEAPWEVLAEIAPQVAAALDPPEAAVTGAADADDRHPDPGSARVVEALGHDPVTVDTLVDRTGLTAHELSSILTHLEIRGIVAREPGAVFVRRARPGTR
jgi:DNA processing protein